MKNLKGKVILIGKDQEQGRLIVAIEGGQVIAVGSLHSVPNSVSRYKTAGGMAHAKIAIDQEGVMVLTNMKQENVTFVNGSAILSKRITSSDIVELGAEHYKVDLPLVLKSASLLVEKTEFNIGYLKQVWDTYELDLECIARKQQEMGKNRMLPIMIGSLSGVASPILATLVAVNTLYLTVPIAAISFGLYLANYRKRDTSYDEKKFASERFTDEYVCPNCGKFLGNISYKLLKKQYSMQCPYCKCKYVE